MEQQDEPVNVPNVGKEKAPCLDTIHKRLQECNGAIDAIFWDLDYITRTEPQQDQPEKEEIDHPKIGTPNLMNIQVETDQLRNRIRDCKKKLDKARWG